MPDEKLNLFNGKHKLLQDELSNFSNTMQSFESGDFSDILPID